MTMMIMETRITDFRITLRIRDQGVITKMIMIMIIEMKKMRMEQRAKWRVKPVAREK